MFNLSWSDHPFNDGPGGIPGWVAPDSTAEFLNRLEHSMKLGGWIVAAAGAPAAKPIFDLASKKAGMMADSYEAQDMQNEISSLVQYYSDGVVHYV